jgi:sugar diacid utilization regulator
MNERILELARQSGGIDLTNHTAGGTTTWVGTGTPEFLEKFAQLIVRECIGTALEQKKWVEEQEVFNLQDEQWNQARIQQSEHIVDKIKEHFGVEE